MKKVPFLLMIPFILAFTNVRADITITDTFKMSDLRANIANLTDYPEIVVVALQEDATMGDKNIRNNSGIYTDKLAISGRAGKKMFYYVVKKEYLDKVDINSIDWKKDAHVQQLNVVNNWPSFTSSEKYYSIDVEFKLAKKNNTYYVYKSRIVAKPRVKETQQTVADEVKTFTDNVVDPLAPIYVSEKWMF